DQHQPVAPEPGAAVAQRPGERPRERRQPAVAVVDHHEVVAAAMHAGEGDGHCPAPRTDSSTGPEEGIAPPNTSAKLARSAASSAALSTATPSAASEVTPKGCSGVPATPQGTIPEKCSRSGSRLSATP